MLSNCSIDPTLYVAEDDRKSQARRSRHITSAEEIAYVDKDSEVSEDVWRHWSAEEKLYEDKRFAASGLPEHNLAEMSWYDECLPSPTFPYDFLDGLSDDLWTLSQSLLLDNDVDQDAEALLTRVKDQRCVWDDSPVSRCASRDSSSVVTCSPKLTNTDGLELVRSTSNSVSSSRSNSLDDSEGHERVWKRRRRHRRRRRRRWSRQSGLGTTSSRVTQHAKHHLSSVYRGARVLRSLLLHRSQYGGYQTETADNQSDSSSYVEVGVGDFVVQTVSTPLLAGSSSQSDSSDANTAAIRRRCLEDHCYFNWKHASAVIFDSTKTSRRNDARRVVQGSTVLELILRRAGPLQPNKGSVANIKTTSTAASRRRSTNFDKAKPAIQSARRRNSNSTHGVQSRPLLHQLLTGNQQKFHQDVPVRFHKEHVGQVLNDDDGQVAHCKLDAADYDVERSVEAAEALKFNSFDDKFQLLSTNLQPDKDLQYYDGMMALSEFNCVMV